ncbi:MAG: glycosyltransferase family 4 protein, partial [Acidimicrobiia bacterium]|nr:glycosyltransferase family 4 protein [Acidimicrobiia bacterium]
MTESTLHVVGVVGNDIDNDSRVKKVAASAASAGLRSTIVCYTPSGVKRVSRMGAVEVVRVPVAFAAQAKGNRVAGQLRPFNADELAIRHAGPRSQLLARRDSLRSALKAEPSGLGTAMTKIQLLWVRISLSVRHETFRARRKAHSEADRAVRAVARIRARVSRRLLGRFRDPIANIADYQNSFGPVLEELEPDLIHAHDFHMIGIAVMAARRLREKGKETRVVYDAHEWIPGLTYSRRTLDAWLDLQTRNIKAVDAIIGVSPQQINLLTEMYDLTVAPTLVLNAPIAHDAPTDVVGVRDALQTSASIITYHGNIQLERGLQTVIDAAALLHSDEQVAIIAPRAPALREALMAGAREAGITPRVHILDYVPDRDLPAFLATADVSVIPYLSTGNNDIALPNKLFESLQAGVPVVVSNMSAMRELVESTGVGLTFEAGDPRDLATTLTRAIAERHRLTSNITSEVKRSFSWTAQADRLAELYSKVLGTSIEMSPLQPEDIEESTVVATSTTGFSRPTRFAVGPHNMAGQAFQIANAVQQHLGIPSISFAFEKPKFQFPIHIQIRLEQWRNPGWQEQQLEFLGSVFSHILTEAGTGPLGNRSGGFIDDQLGLLEGAGLRVGVVLHGSEIRDPRRHRSLPHSPYHVDDELTRSLEKATARLRDHLSRIEVPIFVTTPDLLEDVDAMWLPVTLDVAEWSNLGEPFLAERPRILHMPTSNRLKGTAFIDPVLSRMHDEGLIEYVRPESGLASHDVPAVLAGADIVIDQIVIGAYGVMSCQAMAAGRLSVA